jgi:hypothetical protein
MWISSAFYIGCNFTVMNSPVLQTWVAVMIFFVNLGAFLYMGAYVRNGARFRHHVNCAAYLLMVAALFNLFRIMFNEVWVEFPITLTETVLQVVVFGTIIYHRGNVSYIFPYKRMES